jgi:hypothetical protein
MNDAEVDYVVRLVREFDVAFTDAASELRARQAVLRWASRPPAVPPGTPNLKPPLVPTLPDLRPPTVSPPDLSPPPGRGPTAGD